ncbi:MAG TPA: hypothetical protein VM031_02855, partial [Phycisphaerae bacterium]|nr:hypothetical protein [Phycisphaerae bacterium]
RDLAGPAFVEGTASPGGGDVTFRETRSGAMAATRPDTKTGRFRAILSPGLYNVRCGPVRRRLPLLPMRDYRLDLTPRRALDVALSHRREGDESVTISVEAAGTGRHSFALRAHNLEVPRARQTIDLRPGAPGKLSWPCRPLDPNAPWVVVVVPDGRPDRRVDAVGHAGGGF